MARVLQSGGRGIGFGPLFLGLAALGVASSLGLSALVRAQLETKGDQKASEAKANSTSAPTETARQVTVFAIKATPDTATVDPRLNATIRSQLRKILPDHGFKLLDVQSKRIEVDQAITCDLGQDYTAETVLVRPEDENGKVQLRCSLALKNEPQFTRLVKTPVNQLFFYERSLKDGSRVLIGVGAR